MRFFRIHLGSHVLPFRLIAACALLGLVACTQGEGESCQVDDDCEDGLECTSDGRDIERGVCVEEGTPTDMPMDAGDDNPLDAEPRPPAEEPDAALEEDSGLMGMSPGAGTGG